VPASSSSARTRHGQSCWDRERTRTLGAPQDTDALFITVGGVAATAATSARARAAARRCSERSSRRSALGALAELPDDLRHPHARRHTCATQLLQHGANVADVRRFLGHASVKTTSIYLASDDTRQEEIVHLRSRCRRGPSGSRRWTGRSTPACKQNEREPLAKLTSSEANA
jgi:integrase